MGTRTKMQCTAIVLAAGQGKRMGTKVQKQYLEVEGKPVLYYSLYEFEKSDLIDDVILVVGEGFREYCKEEIVKRYRFTKVKAIVEGGEQRYHSVWNALQVIPEQNRSSCGPDGYVFIHDGARPFVDQDMIRRAYDAVCKYEGCVVGMPVKDTIKISDEADFSKETPNRALVWSIQTPQVFKTSVVFDAYSRLMRQPCIQVTDDAMVVEQMLGRRVKLVKGSYENIKITTPEDLDIAQIFMNRKNE